MLPFNILRHVHPRAAGRIVFEGGGGSSAPAPAPPPPPTYTSSYPELSGKVYNSEAEKNSAEAAVNTDRQTITNYKSSAEATIEQAGANSNLDQIGLAQAKVQAFQAVAKPTVTYGQAEVDGYYNNKLKELVDSYQKAQSDYQTQVTTSTRQITTAALTDPAKLTSQTEVSQVSPTQDQFIAAGTGEVTTPLKTGTTSTVGEVAQAQAPAATPAATYQAQQITPEALAALGQTQAATGTVSPQAQVQAAQQTGPTAVSQLEVAQGNAFLMDNPVQRQIQAGELISGSSVDAAKVEQLNASIQAAEATPSEQATVQGQMVNLMQQFEGGETPAWAASAMRNATAMLSARGLGASSLAGQAVIQAAMESALPIAMADAQTRAQFESQNLSNRQQAAMLAAEQRAQFLQIEFDQDFQARVQNSARIGDIANMNFTAEQQIALENSRAVNTMNLQNLDNRQAKVMAEAAALSNLEIANLNNRQQAVVQNAQAFLQMDLTNLNNEQQTALFKAQAVQQALFSDQAAQNAALQFNAASENQTTQFFASLQESVSRFNADQKNAISQFNAGQENAMEQFNAQLEAQRDQFNAQNSLIVAQANAKWRQDIATLNTSAQNEANMADALAANQITMLALNEVWQKERDMLSYAFQSYESSLTRETELLIADKKVDLAVMEQEAADRAGYASIAGSLLSSIF